MIAPLVFFLFGALAGFVGFAYAVVRVYRNRLPDRPVEPVFGRPDEPPPQSPLVWTSTEKPRVDLVEMQRRRELALLERATGALQPYGLMHVAGLRGDQ